MKLKNLFLPLIAITMCAGFASCDDDDDNDDQEYLEEMESILVNGPGLPGVGYSEFFNGEWPDGLHHQVPGWIIAGYALPDDLGDVSETLKENLPEGKYVSLITPGVYTKLKGLLSFGKDHSFVMYMPNGSDVEKTTGTWVLESKDYLVFDTNINGKTERVRAEIKELRGNYVLLYMKLPGMSTSAYYELVDPRYLEEIVDDDFES